MNARQVAHILGACANPSHSIGHVRCEFDNFGDIMVCQALEELFGGLRLVTYSPDRSPKMRVFRSLFGLRRLFRYCGLGGGTLIFTPRKGGWLSTLEEISAETEPLFVFGTGVMDPDFRRDLGIPLRSETMRSWVECLSRFKFLSVRGVESQRILNDHGLTGVQVIGDPALHFARVRYSSKPRRKRIGVNLTDYSHFWNHSQRQPRSGGARPAMACSRRVGDTRFPCDVGRCRLGSARFERCWWQCGHDRRPFW